MSPPAYEPCSYLSLDQNHTISPIFNCTVARTWDPGISDIGPAPSNSEKSKYYSSDWSRVLRQKLGG